MAGSVLVTYLHIENLGFCPDWWKIFKFIISCFPLKGINNSKGLNWLLNVRLIIPLWSCSQRRTNLCKAKPKFYIHTNRFFPPKIYLAVSIFFKLTDILNQYFKNRSCRCISSNHLGLFLFKLYFWNRVGMVWKFISK